MTEQTLPDIPCLIIEWTKLDDDPDDFPFDGRDSWEAHYYLRLPIDEYDIRRIEDAPPFIKITIGKTKCGGKYPFMFDGVTIALPYRDGVHLMRDAKLLRLPAFVVYGQVVQSINVWDKEGIANR